MTATSLDPAQPWGAEISYDGRAVLVAEGHTVAIRVYDGSPEGSQAPGPTGRYPTVYVSAVVVERDAATGVEIRGQGDVEILPGNSPAVPDPTAIPRAVAAAAADFNRRAAAYTALAAKWPPPTP
ncbi:ATP-binding protein [Kitasatospora sp. CM 4170]|uniref:ATP-binding protein n=1 Tax=Kitasatospora aburaviensis TaxID=67265 RepID=A0ABW1ER39_9ACTN|nr:ATP-binding protein [Kitasatospora sp. CM 4170]WNM45630.1 ATP-binding protein [Kitasatospora sp. CM 4170]